MPDHLLKQPRARRRSSSRRACAILVLPVLLGGCEYGRGAIAMMQSTAAFTACTPDPRILCEPGSEALAAQLAAQLPQAMAAIEQAQFSPFVSTVRVVAYASRESYARYGGVGPESAGAATRGAAHISPAILRHPDGLAKILAHEMSHVHLAQHLGSVKMISLPRWFMEGLATWASDGGGGPVYEPNVRHAIRHGRHFEPIAWQPWWRPFQPPPKGMSWPVYYSQTRMFVRFMHESDPAAFRRLLERLGAREAFPDAIATAYGRPLDALWREFLASLGPGAG